MLQAIDLGAEDFSSDDDVYEIITSPENFNEIRDALSDSGFEFAVAELAFLPQNTTELNDDEDVKKTW